MQQEEQKKKQKPEPKEVFEQKMQKLEKEFDKQMRIRKRSGELEEETKGASEGSQISDEYHYPSGAKYVPIPDGEEGADFGPPIFKRVMRNVTDVQ
jgi:hypothetical protein